MVQMMKLYLMTFENIGEPYGDTLMKALGLDIYSFKEAK